MTGRACDRSRRKTLSPPGHHIANPGVARTAVLARTLMRPRGGQVSRWRGEPRPRTGARSQPAANRCPTPPLQDWLRGPLCFSYRVRRDQARRDAAHCHGEHRAWVSRPQRRLSNKNDADGRRWSPRDRREAAGRTHGKSNSSSSESAAAENRSADSPEIFAPSPAASATPLSLTAPLKICAYALRPEASE
jgi:hypothetical protein